MLFLLLKYAFVSPKLMVPSLLRILEQCVVCRTRLPQRHILSDLGHLRTSQQSRAYTINGQRLPPEYTAMLFAYTISSA